MSETTELIAQQVLNGNINKRTWGDLIYNVKVYGARGNGISDDTSAIRAAVEACSVTGGELHFPPGTYLTDTIYLFQSAGEKMFNVVGSDRKNTFIKKKTADGLPLIQISHSAAHYNGNLVFSGLTFQGVSNTTPAAVRAYNMVWSVFRDCHFTTSIIGLELLGGIQNKFDSCLFDYNQYGTKITYFLNTSGSYDGWPNINTFDTCTMGPNTTWGLHFDYGRMLVIRSCQIEANGTTAGADSGGIYVGSNVGTEGALLTLGVVVESTWFEANAGNSAVLLKSGKNHLSNCYWIANNNATNDIRIQGGNYVLERCDFDNNKTYNILEDNTVLSGNTIEATTFLNGLADGMKTAIILNDGRHFVKNGEFPSVSGLAKPIEQQGADTTAAGVVTVTFPVAFAAAPIVQVTMSNNSATTLDVPEVYNVTTTGFTVRKKSITSGSATVGTTNAGFYWRAIGQGV